MVETDGVVQKICPRFGRLQTVYIKKEEELKALKSEVAVLERKIQLMLPSANKQKKQTTIDKVPTLNNESQNITYTKKDTENLLEIGSRNNSKS